MVALVDDRRADPRLAQLLGDFDACKPAADDDAARGDLSWRFALSCPAHADTSLPFGFALWRRILWICVEARAAWPKPTAIWFNAFARSPIAKSPGTVVCRCSSTAT